MPENEVPQLLSSNTSPQSQCYMYLCNWQHRTGKCQNVKGADDCKQALTRAGRCFVCLKKAILFATVIQRHSALIAEAGTTASTAILHMMQV